MLADKMFDVLETRSTSKRFLFRKTLDCSIKTAKKAPPNVGEREKKMGRGMTPPFGLTYKSRPGVVV